jgi:hypothetical protein
VWSLKPVLIKQSAGDLVDLDWVGAGFVSGTVADELGTDCKWMGASGSTASLTAPTACFA